VKRHSIVHSSFAPLALWGDLASKATEMMWASAQVIAHRTSRMALAGHSPNARDRREFARMGQEKLEAGVKSMQAMGLHWLTISEPWAAMAYRDGMRNYAALVSLASSRTAGQIIARQAALAQALGQSAVGVANAAASATRLAHHGLKPIHATAVANAKRLRKH
jgi:hypothetical protein